MNDQKLMDQNREYFQRLLSQGKRPTEVIFTFRSILNNIDKMQLDETKIDFVIELKEMFLQLKAHWTEMECLSPFDRENKNEIPEKLSTYLKMFNDIIDSTKHTEEINLSQKSIDLSREATIKAKRSNIIAIIAIVIAAISILVTLLLYFL